MDPQGLLEDKEEEISKFKKYDESDDKLRFVLEKPLVCEYKLKDQLEELFSTMPTFVGDKYEPQWNYIGPLKLKDIQKQAYI